MANKEKKKKEDRVKPGGHAPRHDLEESVKLAIAIYENAGGNATLDEFSEITGNTRKSSSFAKKLNALRNYGLATADEENIRLTEVGEQIAAPQEQAEKNAALKEAFLQIEPFKVVYEKFIGKILPQREFLKNAFAQQEAITQELAEVWIDQFVASGKFAGLLMDRGDGKLQVRGTASDKTPKTDSSGGDKQAVEKRPIPVSEVMERDTLQHLSVATSKTPYQFLIEILDAKTMSPDEQAAVWTLIQYLKNKDAGFPSKNLAESE